LPALEPVIYRIGATMYRDPALNSGGTIPHFRIALWISSMRASLSSTVRRLVQRRPAEQRALPHGCARSGRDAQSGYRTAARTAGAGCPYV